MSFFFFLCLFNSLTLSGIHPFVCTRNKSYLGDQGERRKSEEAVLGSSEDTGHPGVVWKGRLSPETWGFGNLC